MLSYILASGGSGGTGAIGHATAVGGILYFVFAVMHIVRIIGHLVRKDFQGAKNEIDKIDDEYKFRNK